MSERNDHAAVRLQHLATKLLRLTRSSQGEGVLTSAQYSAMATLHHRPGISLIDLARMEAVTHPTMSRIVKGLEKSGFIVRHASPDDRRSNLLYLTPCGQELYLRAAARREALFKTILSQLSPSAVSEISEVIERIAGSFDEQFRQR